MKISSLQSGRGSLFNVTRNEWGRVIPAFLVKLLFHTAYVAGGTLLVALFVGKFSTGDLPRMYIVQALFVILGTWLLTGMLRTIAARYLIVIGSTIAAFLLLISINYVDTTIPYFLLAIMALSIFLAQVGIWISIFIENIFSPLEGERVLPVIESAEPIGGILAGTLIVSLIGKVQVEHMLGVVGLVLLLIPPIMIAYLGHLNTFPVMRTKPQTPKRKGSIRMLKDFRNSIYRNRFLAGLFVVIFLQYGAYHIVEFEYTKKMDEHSQHAVHTKTEVYGPMQMDEYEIRSEHIAALMHSLGSVHIVIHFLILIFQLLIASAMLQQLGVMRTFSMAPVMQFFSFVSMLVSFNIVTVLLAKGTYEVSAGMGKSAFVNSFYALTEARRDEAKEILEGIAKPLGLLMGTLVIIVGQMLFTSETIHVVLTICLVLIALCASLTALSLNSHYTLITRKKYETPDNIVEKMDAIEIMSQRGHKGSIDFLVEKLADKQALPEVRIKILNVLGRLGKSSVIPAILDAFEDHDPRIRLAAVQALSNFKNLGEKYFSQAFSRYRVLTSLRHIYTESKNKELKIAAIKVFANLKDPDIIPFLIEVLDSDDPELCAESISVCGMFHDAGTIIHLTPFLEHPHPKVRSAAIIALWQFPSLRLQLIAKMSQMLYSPVLSELHYGINCVGETRSYQEKTRLEELLASEDEMIRHHAVIALAKLDEYVVVDHIIEFLFHPEKTVGLKTKQLIDTLEKKYKRIIRERSLQEVSYRVTKILQESKTTILENLPDANLTELHHLFQLVNAEREAWTVHMILYNREQKKV